MLGDLTATMGQVDDIMVETVRVLLDIDRDAANVILGSSKLADNMGIWQHVIRDRVKSDDLDKLVRAAKRIAESVQKGRNDFVHAVFSRQKIGNSFFNAPFGVGAFAEALPIATVTRRVRKKDIRPVADLAGICVDAAGLSCLVAHISHLSQRGREINSPWRERLPALPPDPPDRNVVRQAKAQKARREPSRP